MPDHEDTSPGPDQPPQLEGLGTLLGTRRSPIQIAGDVITRIGVYLGQDAMPRMAAALAYRTMFSLIPFLLCGFVVLRAFQEKQEEGVEGKNTVVGKLLKYVLDQTGLAAVSAGDQSVEKWITELVNKFNGINFGAIGVVSAMVLIYAALSLLVDIESSFNHIYGAARGRSWVRRVAQYWLMISLGPLLLYAGFQAGESLRNSSETMLVNAGGAQIGAYLVTIASYAVTVAISSLLLTVLFVTIPNTQVKLNSAALGALVAACLLEGAKYGFQSFFKADGYKNLYGALAILPLFLMWVYITWFIVLFGLRVSFLTQHGRTGALLSAFRASNSERLGASWLEPAHAVGVAVSIAERFTQGKTTPTRQIAEESGMDEPTTRLLLIRLEEAGILHRVTSEGREQTFALARPAETIPVSEIVAVGQSLAGPPRSGAAGELLMKIRSAQVQAVAGVSLASLVRRKPATPPQPPAKPASKAGNGSVAAAVAAPQPSPTGAAGQTG